MLYSNHHTPIIAITIIVLVLHVLNLVDIGSCGLESSVFSGLPVRSLRSVFVHVFVLQACLGRGKLLLAVNTRSVKLILRVSSLPY
jgi:hypothetical protein